MKFIETNVIRGPNIWSNKHDQLIVLRFLKQTDDANIDIENLVQEAARHLPGLSAKFSSRTYDVPFIILHTILELFTEAGISCSFSDMKEFGDGTFCIIYNYDIERAAVYASETINRFLEAVLLNKEYDIRKNITRLKEIRINYTVGPTTSYLLKEVKKRGIPYRQFNQGSLITLGHGSRQKKLRTAVSDTTSGLGIELAGDKEETKKLLEEARIPVPKGIVVGSEEELISRITEINFPLVIKPLDGNHGRGVTTDVRSVERAIFGYNIARRISENVIIEEYIEGSDYRFLVINYKLVAVAKRRPAYITGNGHSTIQQLIDESNRDPERGDGNEHVLAQIKVDKVTEKLLSENQLTLDSILPKGKIFYVKDTANISAGGTATDVTDEVHPENKFMAERIARLFNLDICGVDIMATAIDKPITKKNGAVIEVNAGPGLRMHSNPQWGKPRDVASPIIDILFPDAKLANIRIISILTSGETTGALLISAAAAEEKLKAGCNTSKGIFLDGHCIQEGDCSGYFSAQDVLFDPMTEIAILECEMKSIANSGLAFSSCDVCIIATQHVSENEFPTLKLIAKNIKENGYLILNAEADEAITDNLKNLTCKLALFSSQENQKISDHKNAGGLCAFIENNEITVYMNGKKTKLGAFLMVKEKKSRPEIGNILSAVLACVVSGFSMEGIQKILANNKVHSFQQLNSIA